MQYHLILNPAAGKGRAAKLAQKVRKESEKAFPGIQIYETQYAGHASEIADELKKNEDIVIAAGGDGTIHEVVNGLVGGRCILGIIPIGSGNDFIKMLKLPLNIEAAIRVIQTQAMMFIDVGQAGNLYFPNSLGVGFDAEAALESKKVKRLRGFFLYLYAVLKTLFTFQNRQVTLSYNGITETRGIFMLAVSNGQCVGGGFYITPEAKIDDGLFDVCIIRGLSKLEILRHLPKVVKGRHLSLPQVQYFRTNKIQIASQQGIPAQADGELISDSVHKLEIEIVPNALKVIHNLNPL